MTRHLPLLLVAVAGLLGAPATAVAAPTYDIRGTWSESTVGVPSTVTVAYLDCATGAFSGTGTNPSQGGISWNFSGTLTGVALEADAGPYVYATPGAGQPSNYHYFPKMTFGDADHANGTFRQSNFDYPISWTRVSGPPATGGCGPSIPNPTTPEPTTPTDPATPTPAKHPAFLQVMCTYVVATMLDTCTATVGDGAPQPTGATGTVRFAKSEGVFPFGDTCTLASSPTSPSTASCAVTYQRPFGSSKFPEVSAAYSGDATHDPAIGATKFLILGGPANFTSQYPNQVTWNTNVDANGTKVTACATTSAKGTKTALAAAARLTTHELLATRLQWVISDPKRAAEVMEKLGLKLEGMTQEQVIAVLPTLQQHLERARDTFRQSLDELTRLSTQGGTVNQKRIKELGEGLKELEQAMDLVNQAITGLCKADAKAVRYAVVASAAAAKTKKKKPKKAEAFVLGTFKNANAKAGPLAINLKLKPSVLKKVRKGKQPLTVYLQTSTVTPSGVVKKGWPAISIQQVKVGADGKLVP